MEDVSVIKKAAEMNAEHLLAHFDRIADAPEAIPRLRRFVLDLAVRGKLVPQDPSDEPASELLKRIAAEKARLVKAGEIKKNSDLPLVATYEAPFSVPGVWEWTRIGSVAHVEMGQSPPSEHYNRAGHGIPFFQGKADFGKQYPTARYWCTQPKKYADTGDILISVRAPVGPTNIASELCCIGRGLAALRSHNGMDRDYLLRCLEAFELVLAALGFGTTFVAVNKNHLTSFVIPLPPLAEQHRIVAKVDELMTLCDRLEAARMEREATRDRMATASLAHLDTPDPDPATFQNHAAFALNNLTPLTTRPDQIKALRQTILNLAIRGKLVPQDPNDEPASELLKRIATEKERLVKAEEIRKGEISAPIYEDELPFPLPRNWAWSRLHDIGVLYGGMTPSKNRPDFWDGDIVWLSPKDIKADETFNSELKITAFGLSETRLHLFRPDSLFMVARSGILKRTFPVTINRVPASANQDMKVLLPFLDGQERFLQIMFRGLTEFILAELVKTGTTVQSLKYVEFEQQPFPLPPIAEQHRIVAKVDELMTLCDWLEASLATGDETRGRLVEALLHEALVQGTPVQARR